MAIKAMNIYPSVALHQTAVPAQPEETKGPNWVDESSHVDFGNAYNEACLDANKGDEEKRRVM